MRPGGRVYRKVKVLSKPYAHQLVADCNCVTARWGGKQQEATDQSVGDERDSAGPYGEPAWEGRSLDLPGTAGDPSR